MRSLITTRMRAAGAGASSLPRSGSPRRRFGRHQVAELPPISVTWTEHRTHQLRCRHCRARTSARVARADRRLRVRAEVAGGGRDVDRPASCLAPRDLELARDLFGVTLSTGSGRRDLPARLRSARRPALQLQDWVLDQGAVHVDETGWRTRGEGRALWTATTPDATFLQIAEHCNREQFNALIGTHIPGS